VAAEVGDVLRASNTPEDACTMTVVNREGELGVEAHAVFHPHVGPLPPGVNPPGGDSFDFIPAE
jgi:hypothetical protein